jgi:hypothetical protein
MSFASLDRFSASDTPTGLQPRIIIFIWWFWLLHGRRAGVDLESSI